MFKLYKQAFKATNEGIVLTIPLTLFWWLITLYIDYSKSVVDTIPEVVLSAVTMVFMASAFCAGWFYMVKKCVRFSAKDFIMDDDKKSESIKLLKALPQGIGKFFLHYVTVSILFVAIALIMVYVIKILSFPYVKSINDILINYGLVSDTLTDVQTGLDKLSPEVIMSIFHQLLIPGLKLAAVVFAVPAIFSFLLMLWMPEIIYTHKNPFAAIFTSIKKLFKNFGKSLKLYIYITIIQMLISAIGPFSLLNMFMYMLMMIIYFYFIVYVVVLVFMYYESICVQKEE